MTHPGAPGLSLHSDAGPAPRQKLLLTLSLGALGVVYGDIGTSPIYAFREALHARHAGDPTRADVMGILSLIFWSLMIIISIKYVMFVLRADHHGEGGILALTALVNRKMPKHRRDLPILMILGLFGTSLLFGDGMLTPAISVLSAIEGLKIATPAFDHYIVPLTAAILIGLFMFQSRGTEKVGRLFGPIVLLWFLTLALLGLSHVVEAPEVLWAVLPQHGVRYLLETGWIGFAVLGSVFLVVTGGEALYADLGHFGARPIRLTWFAVVLPALILNYFGQGAMLLRHPEAAKDPFFLMVPSWGIYPMVLLTTAATVIASQALITGTYSLSMQALQLGYLPRMRVEHTSAHEVGQIYVPYINWVLMVSCVLLVLTFQSSSNLAAAYGVAVTLTMLITTILLYFILRHGFAWSRMRALALCGFFGAIELVFFAGNIVKVAHGGWLPLAIGGVMYLLMATWRVGRKRIANLQAETGIPLERLVGSLAGQEFVRVEGTAVFMNRNPECVPPALLHNLQHNKVLHERNVIATVVVEDVPYAAPADIVTVEDLGSGFHRIRLRYGYMDRIDVPAVLQTITVEGRPLGDDISYFLSRETILPRRWLWSGMSMWREKIFAVMSRNAEDATAWFNIPPTRVMEVGAQIEI